MFLTRAVNQCTWLFALGLLLSAVPLDATRDLSDYSGPRVVISMTGAASSDVKFQDSVGSYLPSIRHDAPVNEFEVSLQSGEFVLRQTDLFVPGPMPLSITRTWHCSDKVPHAFGTGTNHPYDIYPTGSGGPNLYAALHIILEDGIDIPFSRISAGTSFADGVYRHDGGDSEFQGSQINWNGNGWTLSLKDLSQTIFPDSYRGTSSWWGAPTEIRDGKGNRIQLQRSLARLINRLVAQNGHTVVFQYDRYGRITMAKDDSGNLRHYSYDPTGHLAAVSDASREIYHFVYEPLLYDERFDQFLMTHVVGSDDKDLVRVFYRGGRVASIKLADGSVYQYVYNFGFDNRLRSVDVIFPDGHASHFPM